MGIHGLTSFIDRNPHLMHTHELKDCSVVIDGNNFYHYLYYACHVNCSFGGDYDVYRKKIISTFSALEKCGICPYVVLDGAYTVDDRKLHTSLTRATMRNTLVSVMARFGRGQVLPILAYDTFIQTLTELGVHHVTCQFEADIEIAVLANKLNCPVISNDSDFYIFDLKAGFLPLDYLDFRPLSHDQAPGSDIAVHYLHCQLYQIDDFISAFEGLSRPVLPVFASLLGNDYVKASSFDAFYSRLQTPKTVSKKFNLSPRLSKIIGVIHWFHVHNKDWTKLLQEILEFLQPQSQGRLRKLFFASINTYRNISQFKGCDLFEYFTGNKGDFIPASCQGFSGFNGADFPVWFLNSVCRGEITPSIMNAAVLHRVIFLSQVEDLTQVTSYQCSNSIRKVLYGILCKSDPFVNDKLCGHVNVEDDECKFVESFSDLLKTKSNGSSVDEGTVVSPTDSQDDESDVEKDNAEEEIEIEIVKLISQANQSKLLKRQTLVEEYTRVKRHIERWYVDPTLCVNDLSLPSLSELEDIPVEDRVHIILSALEVPKAFLCKFSQDISLFSSCLLTWLRNADPKVSERHLDCVILCLMYLSIHYNLSCKTYKKRQHSSEEIDIDSVSSKNSNDCENDTAEAQSKIDFVQTWNDVPREQLQKVHQNLSKFHKNAPTFNHKNHMDPTILHAFAQLQACLLDASNLNKLIRFPLPNIQPAFLLNSTFLYNMFSDLIRRPKPDLYVGNLLITDSPAHQVFLEFKSIVKEFLPQNSIFADVPQKHLKKSRKRRAAKIKSSDRTQHDISVVESNDSEEESNEVTVVSGFDISNKFASLLSLH